MSLGKVACAIICSHECSYFSEFFSEFRRYFFSEVDGEASVVTSSILKICRLSLSEVLVRVELRAYARIPMGECACIFKNIINGFLFFYKKLKKIR